MPVNQKVFTCGFPLSNEAKKRIRQIFGRNYGGESLFSQSAAYNVKINLNSIKDKKYISETETKLNLILSDCEKLLKNISKKVEEKL